MKVVIWVVEAQIFYWSDILNEVFIEGPIEACPNQMATYTCRTPLGNAVQADWTVYNNIGAIVATSAGPTVIII